MATIDPAGSIPLIHFYLQVFPRVSFISVYFLSLSFFFTSMNAHETIDKQGKILQ